MMNPTLTRMPVRLYLYASNFAVYCFCYFKMHALNLDLHHLLRQIIKRTES